VVIRFLVWRVEGMPLALVILLSAFAGLVLAAMIAMVQQLRLYSRIRALERERPPAAPPAPPVTPPPTTPPPPVPRRVTDTARLGETVRDLLEGGRHERLAQTLEESHAADVAATLRDLPVPEQLTLFRLLNREQAGGVLAELDDQTLLELVRASTRRRSPGSSTACSPPTPRRSSRSCRRSRPRRSSTS
jgi:hypothetical protein